MILITLCYRATEYRVLLSIPTMEKPTASSHTVSLQSMLYCLFAED